MAINVLVVCALTVVNTHLVVQQSMSVGLGKQVTLHLKTDVATIRHVFANSVADALQFYGNL